MPKRTAEVTVTGGPQGEDAWIKITYPTIDVHRANIKALTSLPKGSDEAEREARKYFSHFVQGWNWVNEDGADLPAPHDNPAAFGALLQPEIEFVGLVIGGQIKPVAPPPPRSSPMVFTEFLEKLSKEAEKLKIERKKKK